MAQDPWSLVRVSASSVLVHQGYCTAPDAAALQARCEELQTRFGQFEQALAQQGPFFGGTSFSVVPADFSARLHAFLLARGSELSRRISARGAETVHG